MSKSIEKAKKTYQRLKKHVESVLFSENILSINVFLLRPHSPNKKMQIESSTLYSFDGPFKLLHVDAANFEFLVKSAVDPKYCLLFI